MKKGSKAALEQSQRMKELHKNPSFKRHWSAAVKMGRQRYWKDPRNKMEQSARMKKWHSDPKNMDAKRRNGTFGGLLKWIRLIEDKLKDRTLSKEIRGNLRSELNIFKMKLEQRQRAFEKREEKRKQNAQN